MLPERKPTRLKHFDYSHFGVYFITICIAERRCLLSKIARNEDRVVVSLSPIGEITREWLQKITEFTPDYCVDQYTIMPNHIHLLLRIQWSETQASKRVTDVIGWLKYQITKDTRTKTDFSQFPLFQRSFYDHIVRNQDDYERIAKYMYENPVMWRDDRFYITEEKDYASDG